MRHLMYGEHCSAAQKVMTSIKPLTTKLEAQKTEQVKEIIVNYDTKRVDNKWLHGQLHYQDLCKLLTVFGQGMVSIFNALSSKILVLCADVASLNPPSLFHFFQKHTKF